MLRSKVDRRRIPGTLFIGLLIVAAREFFLFYDVIQSGRGPVQTDAQILQLPRPGIPQLRPMRAPHVGIAISAQGNDAQPRA